MAQRHSCFAMVAFAGLIAPAMAVAEPQSPGLDSAVSRSQGSDVSSSLFEARANWKAGNLLAARHQLDEIEMQLKNVALYSPEYCDCRLLRASWAVDEDKLEYADKIVDDLHRNAASNAAFSRTSSRWSQILTTSLRNKAILHKTDEALALAHEAENLFHQTENDAGLVAVAICRARLAVTSNPPELQDASRHLDEAADRLMSSVNRRTLPFYELHISILSVGAKISCLEGDAAHAKSSLRFACQTLFSIENKTNTLRYAGFLWRAGETLANCDPTESRKYIDDSARITSELLGPDHELSVCRRSRPLAPQATTANQPEPKVTLDYPETAHPIVAPIHK
ncbi:MAG: hypothetical protein KF847_10055 [Pirellulales bacterium]|nr:hypothetical protein [Pirellulales bacterium]